MGVLPRRVADWFLLDGLTEHDKPIWGRAQTLPDLGELMALWLEGRLQSRPGYPGRVDVDEYLADGLTDALAELCRAGFVTENSQAGRADSVLAEAWVSGFADDATLGWLADAVTGTRFCWYAWSPPTRASWRDWTPVGQPPVEGQTSRRQPEGDLRLFYADCSPAALNALCDAWQVTVYDPTPGRNDMWDVLRRAALNR